MWGITTIVANIRIDCRRPILRDDVSMVEASLDRSSQAAWGVPAAFDFNGRSAQARMGAWILGAALSLVASGCSPFQLAHRTLHGELNQFPRLTDGRASCRLYKQWAHQEWAQIVSNSPDAFSDDYESGFLQGFVDHVYAGGRVVPPTMPPRRYWRLPYRNAQGQLAIREWYAGFEHGARVAHENGYRDRAVIPSSLLPGTTDARDDGRPGDVWIELDPAGPMDESLPTPEPTPALPARPETDDASAPEPPEAPPAEPTTGRARQLTPGGLPIPTDAPTTLTPAEDAESASAMAKPARSPVARAAVSADSTPGAGQASPATRAQATGLSLGPAAEGPPQPPWVAATNRDQPTRSPKVQLASAHMPADDAGSLEGANLENTQAQPAELSFDPFAGTRFAALSPSAARTDGAVTTEPQVGESSKDEAQATAPDSAVTSGHSGTWAARPERPTATDSMPSVKPLEAIVPPPGQSLATLTLPDGSAAGLKPLPSEETVEEKQAPEASRSGASEVESPAPESGPASRGSTPVLSGGAAAAGWQPVQTESAAAWKGK